MNNGIRTTDENAKLGLEAVQSARERPLIISRAILSFFLLQEQALRPVQRVVNRKASPHIVGSTYLLV